MQQSSAAESAGADLPATRRILRRIKSRFFQSETLYRLYLKWKYGTGRLSGPANAELPNAALPNAALQSQAEWMEAAARGKRLHLPLHRSAEKNWDHLAAADAIAGTMPKSARVLDAGAEFYSNVLPALFVYGYRDLYGMNLSFADPARRGPIRYLPGDITSTGFPDSYFDAITCMSVIEHGVPLNAYFREAYRLLKPGGLLITSTDYFPEPIDTSGKFAHGAPIKIFSRSEVQDMLMQARACGFEQTGEIDLECAEPTVRWDLYGLEYTFLIFTLRKG
jgi:SAM-dependent methyltransferase